MQPLWNIPKYILIYKTNIKGEITYIYKNDATKPAIIMTKNTQLMKLMYYVWWLVLINVKYI